MFVNVLLCETAKEDTVEARVKPAQVDTTNVTDARLCLKFREENSKPACRMTVLRDIQVDGAWQALVPGSLRSPLGFTH